MVNWVDKPRSENHWKTKWHKKFVWFPASFRVDENNWRWVWFEYVERKGEFVEGGGLYNVPPGWDYRWRLPSE